jgi:hypothetical protein
MTTGASTNCPKSESSFCNQTISHATIVTPLYFASVRDSATIGCFLLLQLTTPLPKENMKPLVDIISETLPAQSASVYVRQLLSLYFRFYKVTMLESTNAIGERRM